MKYGILILMIFLHIVDDYYLQGWLASAKQKDWWKENAPQALYKYDYIVALFMHSFSWSFMIMLPYSLLAHFNYSLAALAIFFVNIAIHMTVDDMKANKKIINLWTDQLIHLGQIAWTWLILI